MNDRWTAHGRRWAKSERDRVAHRFRSYVRTPSNPRGPIVRQPCPLHPDKVRSEFHHIDYRLPFVGIWCCFSCHRKIDHGNLSVVVEIWDYTPVVEHMFKPGLLGNKNAVRDAVLPVGFKEHSEGASDAPF